MRYTLEFLLVLFFISCQQNSSYTMRSASRSDTLSSEKRQALLPNKLFTALFNGESGRALQKIIDENGRYLLETNQNQDTPLGLAIKSHNLKGALFIARQLPADHYLHQNLQGEGYIYLASQKGYVQLIQFLANRFYERGKDFFIDYEFSDLDMKTNAGERALHVAKNNSVAATLQYEYYRGDLEYPLRGFQYLQNNEGQNFLHTAVRDRNSNLLRWGMDQLCSSQNEWENKKFYEKSAVYLWRAVQTYGGYVWLDWDNIINSPDHKGQTAVNFSAKNMFFEGIHILSACQWVDYLLPDHKGNIPLQNFLLSLDPANPSYGKDVKTTFTSLMESQTRLTWAVISDHINSVNQAGDSSLHISARMADPFFYNELKKYGDREQKNNEGQTAEEIFNLKRRLLNKTEIQFYKPD